MSCLLRTQNGEQINLGKELGRGGEGTVYEVQGMPSVAAKIYHPDKAAERERKIRAMVAAGWHKTASSAAFPIDALFARRTSFVGFTMRRISGQREIHDLYSPTSRRRAFPSAYFRFLVRTSLNIATAIAGVHETHCVIGDLNQSGILIAQNAVSTLIDCDSFQVAVGGETFLCTVGKEEFTPPELQGKRFDRITRTPNHDAFGLAVIIFQLLFMGRHPFAGKFLGKGDMPMQTAIAEYRFAYSSRKNETKMEPPPHVPLLSDLPRELSDAFELAFGQVGSSRGRPSAAEWVSMLERAEPQIAPCQNNPAHQFFRAAASCPWCRMEAAYPGFLAFTPRVLHVSPTPINLGQLIAAIKGVPDPGIVPELESLMPAFSGTAKPIAANKKILAFSYGGALIGVFAAVLLLRSGDLPPAVGFLLLCAAVFLSVRQSKPLEDIEKTLGQAKSAWKNIEEQWNKVRDNSAFLDQRRRAEEITRQLQALPGEETKQLSDLRQKQRDVQLTKFLERFYIDHPATKIRGVGNGRKVMLRSYGIETAADVSQQRIQQISGFGPAITAAIVAWRKSLELRFVFDPSQPVNPADVAAVKARIVARQSQLEKQLRDSFADLQSSSGQLQSLRTHLRTAAISVWNTKTQSDLDAGYVKLFSRRNRIVAAIAAFLLASIAPIPSTPSKPTPSVPVPQRSEGSSTELQKSTNTQQSQAEPNSNTFGKVQSPRQVAQRSVLWEQDHNDPQAGRFPGSAMWYTETASSSAGSAPELEVRGEFVIPERHMAVTLSLRRNTDRALPASHTIQIMFDLQPGFSGEGVSSVPGIFAKNAVEATGTPLAGICVKVTDNYFLLGLSAAPTLQQRNEQLLKTQEWFDIAIVYKNGTKAILAAEKGPPGDKAFADAFTAWGE